MPFTSAIHQIASRLGYGVLDGPWDQGVFSCEAAKTVVLNRRVSRKSDVVLKATLEADGLACLARCDRCAARTEFLVTADRLLSPAGKSLHRQWLSRITAEVETWSHAHRRCSAGPTQIPDRVVSEITRGAVVAKSLARNGEPTHAFLLLLRQGGAGFVVPLDRLPHGNATAVNRAVGGVQALVRGYLRHSAEEIEAVGLIGDLQRIAPMDPQTRANCGLSALSEDSHFIPLGAVTRTTGAVAIEGVPSNQRGNSEGATMWWPMSGPHDLLDGILAEPR